MARAVQFFSAFFIMSAVFSVAAHAQNARTVVTSENSDYFGFDLRTEKDVPLESCEAICLADPSCRAFTYNTRAQWCFLKSDYAVMNPFAGAVAGKVVELAGQPDLGAPPELDFIDETLADQAIRFRRDVVASEPQESVGLSFLSASADGSMSAGDPRAAAQSYRAALAISPEDAETWIGLAQATLAIPFSDPTEGERLNQDSASAAFNAYLATRTAGQRARALSLIGQALDRLDLYRDGLQAYEASLALVDDDAVRAAYEDLKARKGFRVVEHSVDSDLPSPRVCMQLSEELAKGGVDYASFLTVDGRAPQAIEASGQQICVEGLEHGSRYNVVLRPGLPAASGETIENPVELSIYVRDRAPTIRFTGENFVLPAAGRHGVPMVSVNTDSAELQLHRIGDRALTQLLANQQFLRQLDGYSIETLDDGLGEPVWEGSIEIDNEPNEDVLTSFPVDEALPRREPGVYVLTAVPEGDSSEYWTAKATQWFLVSDIGLSTYAGADGLNVFARSLASAAPLAGVELQLLARNNEILGAATTDAQGRATFNPGLTRGTASMAPAVLSAKNGTDFVFLDMTRAGFDLSDRGVTGRAAPGAVDVFAWTERGIYRVGETVHAAALARDDRSEAVLNLPLTFIFTRPDGVEDRRVVSDGRALGGHHVPYDIPATAMRGTWTVKIHADPKQPALAEARFLVEDFVPDRIEFDLTSETDEIAAGEPVTMNVEGRYLYGAPAGGLALEGEVAVSTTREWDRYPSYRFGLADEEIETGIATTLDDIGPTDEAGQARFEAFIDELPSTTRLLQAQVSVRMSEGGGRAVERRAELTIRPEGPVIGMKPEFSGAEVPENSTPAFRVIAVAPEGDRIALSGARWTLVKVERHYQWYRADNSWNYEPVTMEREVASGILDISTGEPAEVSVPVDWGRYRLQVETDDPAGPTASFEFDAGWFVEAASTETPDGLEIALDKERYEVGETARLQVSPRFAGELLVTIGSERLIATYTQSIPAEGGEVTIPVTDEWGAGAYVTATLFRPGDAKQSRMPARAIGVKWLSVDPAERRLEVSLEPPARAAPRESLAIPVTLAGLEPGEEAYVAVAAVDVGILNLTGYEPPDPEGWYFGQRRLGLELRDLYGRLIDGSAGAFGRIRTGGDGGASMATQGSAPTEKLLAFFSGPVRVGADGKAEISFDLPEFNGTARVMAVAWSKEAVGQASTDVIVRDPLVITAGHPRFLAVGDSAAIRLDIANTDGPAGDYAVSARVAGTATLQLGSTPASVTLAEDARTTLTLPVDAVDTGDATITVGLVHESGLSVERTLFLPVRQPAAQQTTRRVVSLAPNGGSIRVDRELLAASLLDGASVTVGVSPASALDIPSLLMTLDRYPYGCAEQTTSRALPLLYVSELSKASGLEDDPALRERVQEAIDRVLTFQSNSGSFGLWGPGFGDMWLDAYIGDFLTRAREAGYRVPALAMTAALDNLQNQLAYTTDVETQGSQIAYALYVLARSNRASVGDLRYYADTRLDEFRSPMARAQLAAALALYGDGPRAERVFASALRRAQTNDRVDFYRSDYGSSLRDGAAVLALAAETQPTPSVIPALLDFVADERQERSYTSTQEEVWMLLAARAISAAGDAISLDVDGAAHQGAYSRRISGEALLDDPVTVTNTGSEAVEAVVTTVAAPADPLPAGGDGFSIERTYYTLDGEEANVTQARQNERFVVVLRMTEMNEWPSRVAVTDLLPAGFEIDNPRLVGSAELSNFEWLGTPEVAHSEFRDDRFVVAFDRMPEMPREFSVAYVVRAVTPGVYVHPAAVVEDMYRPQFNARTASGFMEVTAGR